MNSILVGCSWVNGRLITVQSLSTNTNRPDCSSSSLGIINNSGRWLAAAHDFPFTNFRPRGWLILRSSLIALPFWVGELRELRDQVEISRSMHPGSASLQRNFIGNYSSNSSDISNFSNSWWHWKYRFEVLEENFYHSERWLKFLSITNCIYRYITHTYTCNIITRYSQIY